jgi:hypothetical protein
MLPEGQDWPCRRCGRAHPPPCSELRRLAAELARASAMADVDEADRIRDYEAQRLRK